MHDVLAFRGMGGGSFAIPRFSSPSSSTCSASVKNMGGVENGMSQYLQAKHDDSCGLVMRYLVLEGKNRKRRRNLGSARRVFWSGEGGEIHGGNYFEWKFWPEL